MAAYCSTDDLLTGNIPTPGYLSKDKFVTDAADEIDSTIGFVYETPIDVSDNSDVVRPARLLLKRINVFLATGRLLMAAASSGEDTNLHAYALKMVNDALKALEQIRSGEILLEGAILLDPPDASQHRGPTIANVDIESAVEAFYDNLVPTNFLGSRVNGVPYYVDAERYPRYAGG